MRSHCRIAASVACWLALVACSDAGDSAHRDVNIVRYGTGTQLQTFDPHQADTGSAMSTYLSLVYDGLTRGDPHNPGEVLPSLATSWRWLDDMTIEFDLRRGVRFTDGTLFDANVARANLERMLALRGPRVATMAAIATVTAVDDYTLRIGLGWPDPTLLSNLAISPGLMVSPAAFDKPDLDLDPVGTGPWRYDRARSIIGAVHRFDLNPDHWDSHPPGRAPYEIHLLSDGRARANALVSGQIDFAVIGPSEAAYAERMGFAVARRANRWLGMTILDRQGELVPALADRRVRQALGFAVDRRALADVVFFGYAEPASQPMRPGIGYVDELSHFFSYDPNRARALLGEAGVEHFSFDVPVPPNNSAEYEVIQHYLKQIGVDMRIRVIEPGSMAPLSRTKQYPVNTIGYPTFDPDSRHMAIWGSTAAFNPFRNETARLDVLAEQARATLDESLRHQLFQDYFRIVVEEGYSIVYLYLEDLVAYDPTRVRDVMVSRYIDPTMREVKLAAPTQVARP
jgi:peptide/nickel transport system substrate-binding protein